jgi:hypothetical protein
MTITTDSRVRIFDKGGNYLVDIQARVTRSWELNAWGEASFLIPYSETKFKEKNFQFGNLLLIETNNLPDWGGVIDGSRDWGQLEAKINAKSAEYFFATRWLMSPYTATDEPGGHFKALVHRANLDEDTCIDPGVITGDGASFEFPLSYVKLSDAIDDLLEKSGFDYSVTPYINTNGNLTFRANLYTKRLSNRLTVLKEGFNLRVGNKSLSEYPPKANDILAFGNSAKDAEKEHYRQDNHYSRRKYRLYQRCISVSSNTPADVREAVLSALKLDSQKQNVFSDMVGLNKGNLFDDLGIGNVLPVEFVQYGFGLETSARITRLEYTDGADEVKITAEEYDGTE